MWRRGDPRCRGERAHIIKPVELLDTTDEAEALAGRSMDRLAVPAFPPRNALHISIAAVHSIEFIVTWNFERVLNPHLQAKNGGYVP